MDETVESVSIYVSMTVLVENESGQTTSFRRAECTLGTRRLHVLGERLPAEQPT